MKTLKQLFLLALPTAVLCGCAQPELPRNVAELCDANPSTEARFAAGDATVLFDGFDTPMVNYSIYSSGADPSEDPAGWILCGSTDGRKWVELDRRDNAAFCSRFQEIPGEITAPESYALYRIQFLPREGADSIAVGDVHFSERNIEREWCGFIYPEIAFEVLDPDTEGAAIYGRLVQDPDAYIRYHTRKVAEILFYSAADTMNTVGKIDYTLKDYEGVSAKSGTPAETAIVYSTRHIEKSARESMYKLDFETRGVLFHELVHAYQFEPKGIGTYGTNREFWACIEGLADAVRTEAGLFDVAALRKPGGHWLDGYKTTGFFLQWLTTKDSDALRKFHVTVRDLNPWSFDGAMQAIFGRGIEDLWNEYQQFLSSEAA